MAASGMATASVEGGGARLQQILTLLCVRGLKMMIMVVGGQRKKVWFVVRSWQRRCMVVMVILWWLA